MLKRTLVCLPVLFLLFAALCGAQTLTASDPDLENQVQDLKKENDDLRSKVDRLEEKVDAMAQKTADEGTGCYDKYYSLYQDEVYSPYIRKGSETGMLDKLMNVNLFIGVRWQSIQNWNGAPASGCVDAPRGDRKK